MLVQVKEQSLGSVHDTATVRHFSVNIYSYPVQWNDAFRETSDEKKKIDICLCHRNRDCIRRAA